MTTMRNFAPAHFDWQWDAGIATVSLHGAARKNPLTFESYAELRDMFRENFARQNYAALGIQPAM